MQTPKARSSSSSGALQRTEKASPRVARQLNTGPRYTEHTASSSNSAIRAPSEASPKVADRRSPRSPASSEKKRPTSRVSELESQVSQLENDLKIVKDQLCLTEAAKKQAQKDAEESNHQLFALSLKLEESEKHLSEKTSASEQDQALHLELKAELASALDEIKQLKLQLELVTESEAANSKRLESDQNELYMLKHNLSDTLLLVEDMRNQLKECNESEAQAQACVGDTLVQLETAKKMVEILKFDGLKATEAYNAVTSELDESKARVTLLEELVSKFKDDAKAQEVVACGKRDDKLEVEVYNEEQAQNAEKIRNAFGLVEKIKLECGERVEELEKELRKSKYEIEELKANLMDKETELQGICEENEGLSMKLKNILSGEREDELENLKASLKDKEVLWQNSLEDNEKLKLEMKEMSSRSHEHASEIEEALMMAEEVDKSNRKAARVAEQLEAAQAANSRMEGELRRMKVQSDQWRKAAETAAAMLSAGNNGVLMGRTGSLDSPRSGKIGSPYAQDLDDKKNANMLKRIGVLWKKPHK